MNGGKVEMKVFVVVGKFNGGMLDNSEAVMMVAPIGKKRERGQQVGYYGLWFVPRMCSVSMKVYGVYGSGEEDSNKEGIDGSGW
ncbi:unnamed protein product [Dovyalis caffra]|uniref:Uncharacterized protein n=1 Tax=Dovyalis caffra TaxID=77055 RepID=A0AAV1R479_9ROSI|nr:unnamed protein product [Dovyalis caffra]